jgi:hypothetical protein
LNSIEFNFVALDTCVSAPTCVRAGALSRTGPAQVLGLDSKLSRGITPWTLPRLTVQQLVAQPFDCPALAAIA